MNPQIVPASHNNKTTNGFTLVELSIVLVIISLIVGGVLLGNDLIEAAKVRKQISQLEEIESQINAFKLKYGYLPGDIPDASQVFGASFGGYNVVNGNGDGHIVGSIINGGTVLDCVNAVGYQHHAIAPRTGFSDSPGEVAQVFHHLNAAGLGNYNINDTAYFSSGMFSGQSVIQTTSPKPPFDIFGSRIIVTCTRSTNPVGENWVTNFYADYAIIFGGQGGTQSSGLGIYWGMVNDAKTISPNIGKQIDTKIDDGKPLSGIFGTYGRCSPYTTYESCSATAYAPYLKIVKK